MEKKVKLIIALVGNVSNNSIGWISTNLIIYIRGIFFVWTEYYGVSNNRGEWNHSVG